MILLLQLLVRDPTAFKEMVCDPIRFRQFVGVPAGSDELMDLRQILCASDIDKFLTELLNELGTGETEKVKPFKLLVILMVTSKPKLNTSEDGYFVYI